MGRGCGRPAPRAILSRPTPIPHHGPEGRRPTLPPRSYPTRGIQAGRGVVGLGLLVAALAPGAGAQERVFRTFGQEQGLLVPPVWALAQDSVGFIWIGAEAGLFRFDGSEILRWAPERIPTLIMDIAVSGAGRVVALAADGRIHEVVGSDAPPIELPWVPADTPRRSGRVLAFDHQGALWAHVGDSIWSVRPDTATVHTAADFAGETPRGLVKAVEGALVLTTGGLWRVSSKASPQRLYRTVDADREVIAWAIEPEPDRVLALINVSRTQIPRVVEVLNGRVREVETSVPLAASRAVQLRELHGTLWVAVDRFLAAIRPGERPEVLGPEEGFESGGPLLVDREGSLWVGSFVGIHQYPEPDTRIWAGRQGIPSRHTRFLEQSGEATWVMTWNGPAVVEHTDGGWQATPTPWDSRSHICRSEDGVVWSASETGLVEIRGASAAPRAGQPSPPIHGCTPARGGGAWLGTLDGLWWVRSGPEAPLRVDAPYPDEVRDPRPALLHDRSGRLWVGAGSAVCHAPAERLRSGESGLWRCDEVATPSGLMAMVELDDGRLWAATGPGGLLEYDGSAWSPRLLDGTPTQTVHALRHSERGGVWLVGEGILMRVRPRVDGGLDVLERLTPWHGLPSESAGALLENEAGDIWLATNQGAVHVPASVRFEDPSLPPVALVEGRVDGEPIRLDGPLELSHDRNRIELRFAALTFRHREGLRHQVRLSPAEPWTESAGEPLFRWVDLPAGTYHAEYRASRDGRTWSTTSAAFTFRVRPPWYASWWFLLLAGLAAVAVAAALYRARVRYLVDLERTRTRIAMDLHDQVGSGLASVGILSGVIASDRLAPDERTRTAREIAEVAEELGHSLSDIVWSLDPQTSNLEELATRLTEHGERLFPDEDVLFEARLPPRWTSVTSSVAVRRAVLLIGLEALHNAARHAGARRVTLRLRALPRGVWELAVRDDGTGVGSRHESGRPTRGSGRGLEGMERRAASIGAVLDVDSGPGGTTVTLRFRPQENRLRPLNRSLT